MTHTDSPTELAAREARVQAAQAKYSGGTLAWVVKIILLGLVDAILVMGVLAAAAKESWLILIALIAIGAVVNVVYLPANRMLPGKYLSPGILFMLTFSVSVMLYTVFIAFTNYGDGHNGTKQDAINAIQKNNLARVADSPTYKAAVATKNGELWLVVIDPTDQKAYAGSNTEPLKPIEGVQLNSVGNITGAPGFDVLPFAQISQRSNEVSALRVPRSDNVEDGFLSTTTGSQAYAYKSTIKYDRASDTMIAPDGTVYRDNGQGSFATDAGQVIDPGWQVLVGGKNFVSAFSDPQVAQPFFKVTLWTFAFAFLSTLLCFALGLFLAIVFNQAGMRGKRIYRIVMILPYAFPGTMMTMVWSGLFNQDFGFINQVLLGGTAVPWFNDGTLAKVAILIVNLWLGFPYQFLVSTGALQSIPEDVIEAAEVDGATGWRTFQHIKLPLLMVSLAPLLISSFAFNFNNFNLIFMLTRGGPRFADTSLDVGETDILISMVYKVAFGDAARDFGLGSAFAILIFLIVGIVSAIGFRQTRALEDIN